MTRSAVPAGLDVISICLPSVKTLGYFSSLTDGASVPAFAVASGRALSLPARAMQTEFSNHKLNKSRGGKVERLVNFSENYEKNSLCINDACLCCVCSSAGQGS